MRSSILVFSALSMFLVACESTPGDDAASTPPPAQQLLGGPCDYDETPAIAIVTDVDGDQVRFLIDGKVTPYALADLPTGYKYEKGEQFNVIEKRITQGTCTPYILEIVSPVNPEPDASAPVERRQPMDRTQIRPNIDPTLR